MSESKLSNDQKQKIEAKRQEALKRKRRKVDNPKPVSSTTAERPSVKSLFGSNPTGFQNHSTKRKTNHYFKDTEAGFLADPEDEAAFDTMIKDATDDSDANKEDLAPPVSTVLHGGPKCIDCNKEFYESFLSRYFDLNVCDDCRKEQKDGKYSLVSKTTAKNEYLLRESELDPDMGGLKFVERKNPHKDTYAKMKLFLRHQVEELSFKNYGGLEGLEAEHQKREDRQTSLKTKRHEKKMNKMRKEIMTSTWLKQRKSHEHSFGEEQYDADNDEYFRVCECGFKRSYEKL